MNPAMTSAPGTVVAKSCAPDVAEAAVPQSGPALSVLMCVYNGERFLAAAIESILNQTFTNFEFVIVDDGSIDSTPMILEGYLQQDSRVRVIRQGNQGLPSARNTALANVKTDVIAWMDADDLSEPHRLELQLQYLATHPECIVVGGQWACIDEVGRILYSRPAALDHAGIVSSLLNGVNELASPAVMIRNRCLQRAGSYNPEMRVIEDLDMWLRLYKLGQFANLPARVLRYRLHSNQISSCQSARQAITAITRVNEERALLQLMPLPIPESFRETIDRPADAKFELAMQCWHYGSNESARRLMLSALMLQPTSVSKWLCIVVISLGLSLPAATTVLSQLRRLQFWK